MKKLLPAAALTLLCIITLQSKEIDVERSMLAEELMTLTKTKEQISKAYECYKKLQLTTLNKLDINKVKKEQAKEAQKKINKIISDEISWESLKDDYIDLYAETYTKEELQGLINFYKSPLGQKVLAKSPLLAKKRMVIMQQKMQAITPLLQNIHEEFSER